MSEIVGGPPMITSPIKVDVLQSARPIAQRVHEMKQLAGLQRKKSASKRNKLTFPELRLIGKDSARIKKILQSPKVNAIKGQSRANELLMKADFVKLPISQLRHSYGVEKYMGQYSKKNSTMGASNRFNSVGPYVNDPGRSQETASKNKAVQRNFAGIASKSESSDEIVRVGKKVTRRFTVVEDDDSPEYLLPSNGGYNPKQKSMYVDDDEVMIELAKPKKLDYVT